MKRIDKNGNVVVLIPFSYEIPFFIFERELRNTIYTISGHYDGNQTLPNQVFQLMLQDMKKDPQED